MIHDLLMNLNKFVYLKFVMSCTDVNDKGIIKIIQGVQN